MSDNTNSYELVSGNHRQDGSVYGPGDVVELTDDEYEAFSFHFEETDEEPTDPSVAEDAPPNRDSDSDSDSDEDSSGDEGDESDFSAADFVDRNARAVRSAISDGEADGHLEEVRQAEEERKDRTTVIAKISDRENTLESEDEE